MLDFGTDVADAPGILFGATMAIFSWYGNPTILVGKSDITYQSLWY